MKGRSDTGRQGKGKSKGSGKGKPLVSLGSKRLPYGYSGSVAWDLQGVDKSVLKNAKRVQFTWHQANVDPKKNPHGNGQGQGTRGQ